MPQHVLRFWESRFPQIRPMKRGGGRRYYRPDDVDLLRGIRHLLYGEGYTIRGVQRILREQGVTVVQTVWRVDVEPSEATGRRRSGRGRRRAIGRTAVGAEPVCGRRRAARTETGRRAGAAAACAGARAARPRRRGAAQAAIRARRIDPLPRHYRRRARAPLSIAIGTSNVLAPTRQPVAPAARILSLPVDINETLTTEAEPAAWDVGKGRRDAIPTGTNQIWG